MASNYSITAYKVIVKDREKGIGGISLKDLTDMSHYHNKATLISGFLKAISNGINDNSILFKLTSCIALDDFNGLSVRRVKLRYGGRNGTSFSVVSSGVENAYSENDKIVRNYTVYFFFSDSVAYMVALRIGLSSCKSAIEKEFQRLFDKGNAILLMPPISNNDFIMEHYKDCVFNSLSYEVLYKYDDGDVTREKDRKKETFSSVSISLTNERNKKMFNLNGIKNILTGTEKTAVISTLKTHIDDFYELDEESIKVEVVLNGTKRSICLNSLSNLMFDVDITDIIQRDDNSEVVDESLDEIVQNYMKGIIENDI